MDSWRHMVWEEPEVWLHSFLSSVLARGAWSDSRPSQFTPPPPLPVKEPEAFFEQYSEAVWYIDLLPLSVFEP
jgi:hypothetical protein